MERMDNRLLDFLSGLDHAESTGEAWRRTVAFMHGQGASQFAISMELDSADPLFMWTFPPWVAEQYVEEVFPDCDPTLAHCRVNVTPFFSGTAFRHRYPDLPAPYHRFLEDLAANDVCSAVSIPVHGGSDGDWGKFGYGTALGAGEFEGFYAERGFTLYMAGTMAFNRMRALVKRERTPQIGLTDDERECLLWLSRGLLRNEIADRLGLRPVTVRRCLAEARRKLDAHTLDQALANAVQMGLVEP